MTLKDIVNISNTNRESNLILKIDSSSNLFNLRHLVVDNPSLFQRTHTAKAFCSKIETMQVKLDGKVLSLLLTSLSKIKVPASTTAMFEKMMHKLAKIATYGLHKFSAKEISFILHSLCKKNIRNKAFVETVGKIMLSSRFQTFYPIDISMILCACLRLEFRDMSFFDPLAELVIPELSSYGSPELSGVVWAFASFQNPPPNMLSNAASVAVGIASTFNSQDMARLLRGFATAGYWDEKLGEIMAKRAISIMGTFSTTDIAHLANAYCKQGKSQQELFLAISQHVIENSHKMTADDIGNIIHAFANLNHGNRAFYDEIASAAIRIMDTFQPVQLQSTMRSYATANHFHADLFAEVAESSILNMDSFSISNLKFVVRSFSKLQYYHVELILEVGRQLVAENGKFHVEILVHVLEAFAKLNIKSSMIGELLAKCKNVIPILNTTEALRMVISLSRLQVAVDCIDGISQKISKDSPDLTSYEIIEVAKAFTIVQYKNTFFWSELGTEILSRDDSKWTAKELGVLCSAFGSMSSSLCAEPRPGVVSMCFRRFQLKDSSQVTIQDIAAVSSAIPYGKRLGLFPTGFVDHVIQLANSKGPEARHDDVRCVLINLSQIDLSVSSRRKFLGIYRSIFNEVSLFLSSEDCQKITDIYREMDQIRDDSTWSNNFSFLHISF